jgi:hypothetical protein
MRVTHSWLFKWLVIGLEKASNPGILVSGFFFGSILYAISQGSFTNHIAKGVDW